MTEQQERDKILKHLDKVADDWGIPKLSNSTRTGASLKTLRRAYRNCFKGG